MTLNRCPKSTTKLTKSSESSFFKSKDVLTSFDTQQSPTSKLKERKKALERFHMYSLENSPLVQFMQAIGSKQRKSPNKRSPVKQP